MPSACPEFEGEAHAGDDRRRAAGRRHRHLLDIAAARRARQLRGRHLRLPSRQCFRQPGDALPRRHEGPPIGDRGLDRRQGTPHHDRSGDHRAGGELLIDHEIGAEPQDHRLQQQPQHLRDAAKAAGDVAHAPDGADVAIVELHPALRQRRGHGHRRDGLAAVPTRLEHGRSHGGIPGGRLRRQAAGTLGQQGHREQHDAASGRSEPQPGMNQKADRQEHRDPGQIHDCDRAGAGEEGPDLIEVANRLRPLARMPVGDREADHRGVRAQRQALVEQRRRPRDQARADDVEHALERVSADQEHGERHQRRHAAARQHAVVDLQHVERAGQHQQVHDAGEQRDAGKRPGAFLQRARDFGMSARRAQIRALHLCSPIR
jgi:hypothetical protein